MPLMPLLFQLLNASHVEAPSFPGDAVRARSCVDCVDFCANPARAFCCFVPAAAQPSAACSLTPRAPHFTATLTHPLPLFSDPDFVPVNTLAAGIATYQLSTAPPPSFPAGICTSI